MNEKLRIMPFQIIEMEDRLILKRGVSTIIIPDKNAMVIIRVIQKALAKANYTAQELASFFSANTRELILSFVDNLIQRKFILLLDNNKVSSISTTENPQDIFYWHFNKHQDEVAKILNNQSIAFVGINELNKRMIAALLREGTTKITVIDDPSLRKIDFFNEAFECIDPFWNQDILQIISEDDFLDAKRNIGFMVAASEFGSFYLLEDWNTYAVKNKIPFYPVVLQNMVGYAGPLVIPGAGACLECLTHRQNSHVVNFNEKRAIEKFAYESQPYAAYHQSMLTILAEVSIFDLIKFINNIHWDVGSLCEIDLLSGNMTRRKLVKAPRCKTCSSAYTHPLINLSKQLTSDEAWAEIEQKETYEN